MSKNSSKTSLNSILKHQPVVQQPAQDPNIYEFLDDFTDEDEPVASPPPPMPKPKPKPKQKQQQQQKSQNIRKQQSMTSPVMLPQRPKSPAASIQNSQHSRSSSRPSSSRSRPGSSVSTLASNSFQRNPTNVNTRLIYNNEEASREKMRVSFVIYRRVQGTLVTTCLLLTLVQLGIVIWIHVDPRFRFLASISNTLPYATLDRLFGLYPVIALSLSSLALILDIIQIGQLVFIKGYLRAKEKERLTRYRYVRLQQLIMYVKSYTLMTHLFYIFIVISLQLFIASYLIVNFQLILNYQTPQTLIKLLREYEKHSSDKEPKLVASMHTVFSCCHYQNPYQFGDLSPPECNKTQGCLRPIQEFEWVYLYVSIALVIAFSVFKFAIQILLLLNFYWLLLNRIIRQLNHRKQIELAEMGIHDDDDDDDDERGSEHRAEANRKLAEIRRAKEAQLELEEREEEEQRQRELEERLRREEYEKRQDEYELMLFKQKRYDELRIEQMNRRMHQQQFQSEN